jgi:hypothetical protein
LIQNIQAKSENSRFGSEHTLVSCLDRVWRRQACHTLAHADTQGPFGTIGDNRRSEPIDRQRDSHSLRTNEPNYQNQFFKLELNEYTQ